MKASQVWTQRTPYNAQLNRGPKSYSYYRWLCSCPSRGQNETYYGGSAGREISRDECVGCDLTHYLTIPGTGPASAMFCPLMLQNRTERTGNGYYWRGLQVARSREPTFIAPRMLSHEVGLGQRFLRVSQGCHKGESDADQTGESLMEVSLSRMHRKSCRKMMGVMDSAINLVPDHARFGMIMSDWDGSCHRRYLLLGLG